MISQEKSDLIYLLHVDVTKYNAFSARIINIEGKDPDVKMRLNSIIKMKIAKYIKLYIKNMCFNMENEQAIIDIIKVKKKLNFLT